MCASENKGRESLDRSIRLFGPENRWPLWAWPLQFALKTRQDESVMELNCPWCLWWLSPTSSDRTAKNTTPGKPRSKSRLPAQSTDGACSNRAGLTGKPSKQACVLHVRERTKPIIHGVLPGSRHDLLSSRHGEKETQGGSAKQHRYLTTCCCVLARWTSWDFHVVELDGQGVGEI